MMPLKEFGYRVFSTLYELVFKEKVSHEALNFFTGTSYVAIGTLFGGLLTFAWGVLAARTLGPSNFGNVGLVMSMGAILAISMGPSHTGAV